MVVTPESLKAIYTQFDLRFRTAYEAQPVYWPEVASMVPSNTKRNTYAWMAKLPRFRKWVGPRTVHSIASRGYTIENERFEDTVGVDVDDIEDEQLGVYNGMIDELGQQAKLWPDDQLVSQVIEFNAGAGPVGYDGVSYWHAAHPRDVDKPGGSTYQNLFNVANGGAVALTPENVGLKWQEGLNFKGEDDRSLNVQFTHLMVPAGLAFRGKQITESGIIAAAAGINAATGSSENVLKGMLKLVVNPYLTSQTAWYLLCCNRGVKPFIFQQRRAPRFIFKNQPTDESVFNDNQALFGGDARGGFGVSLPFLAIKCDTV